MSSVDPFDTLDIRLGLAYAASGSRGEALAAYRRAVREDPRAYPGHFLLGVEACHDLEWETAFRQFVAVIERAPAVAEAYNNLGTVYWNQGDVASAQVSWEKALSLKPRLPYALLNLGTAHLANGRLVEGQSCMERAIGLAPTMPEAYNNLGAALYFGGQQDGAQSAFAKAVALDPQLAAPLRNLALVYGAKGQETEARHCRNQATVARHQAASRLGTLELLVPIARHLHVDPDEGLSDRETVIYDLDAEL